MSLVLLFQYFMHSIPSLLAYNNPFPIESWYAFDLVQYHKRGLQIVCRFSTYGSKRIEWHTYIFLQNTFPILPTSITVKQGLRTAKCYNIPKRRKQWPILSSYKPSVLQTISTLIQLLISHMTIYISPHNSSLLLNAAVSGLRSNHHTPHITYKKHYGTSPHAIYLTFGQMGQINWIPTSYFY